MVSEAESIPRVSESALYARSTLFQQFNAIDFYVEDEEQENLYFTIIKKLFPLIRLKNIFPLRGKQNLLARAFSQEVSARKSVYIADKDFDDILGKVQVKENVFYLRRFCIENYLLEEAAFVGFVVSELPRLKREDIIVLLKFAIHLQGIVKELRKLFSLYLIVQRIPLRVKSTAMPLNQVFKSDSRASLDPAFLESYGKTVASALRKHNETLILHEEIEQCSAWFDENDLTAAHISGEYIIWRLAHITKTQFNVVNDITIDSLRYRLAEYCSFESLGELKVRIQAYLDAPEQPKCGAL